MPDSRVTSKIEFQVDIVWKVVVLGALALAARLSWLAWEGAQEQVRLNTVAIQRLTTLVETGEIRLQFLERVTSSHGAVLDTLRGFPSASK